MLSTKTTGNMDVFGKHILRKTAARAVVLAANQCELSSDLM